eukprot:269614_1
MNDTCCDKWASLLGCGCCMNASEYKKVELAQVVENDQRKCTDIPCCLLLFTCIIVEILIVIECSRSGTNPLSLLHGTDYNGTLCDESNVNGPYVVWPSLLYFSIRLCSSSCSFSNDPNNKLMVDHYESTLFMNAFCIPDNSLPNSIDVTLDNFSSNFRRALGDLYISKWLILILSFAAIILSFIYLQLISTFSKVLIIFTVFMILISGTLFSWLLFADGLKNYYIPGIEHIGLIELIVAAVATFFLICLLLALWFSRKNIELVVDLFKEATHAIYDMKLTLIFPMWMSLIGIVYVAYWITESLYIYSVKIQTTKSMPDNFQSDILNGLYPPTYQHIRFDYYAMKAGVFADWYFSQWLDENKMKKQRGNNNSQLSYSPIWKSIYRVLRYHIGSLAFGALIVTLITILRGFFDYMFRKTLHAENPVSKCIRCMVSCCLHCFECILNRLNKNGFIFTSIFGTAFCYSSYCSLQLMVENANKIILITGISKYTHEFGRFVISLLNTGIALLVMKYNTYFENNLESCLFPCIIIFIITFIVSSLFMNVLNVGVQTIFLCFLVDESVNGNAKYAPKEMKELIDTTERLYSNETNNKGNVQTYTDV